MNDMNAANSKPESQAKVATGAVEAQHKTVQAGSTSQAASSAAPSATASLKVDSSAPVQTKVSNSSKLLCFP